MERYARFQGSWYPAERDKLLAMIGYEEGERAARIAILPHSGLLYSKEHIKRYFSTLSEDIERILIISPSHRYYLEPDMLVSASFSSSATPLGPIETVPMDIGIRHDRAMQEEHGVEMFLPSIALKGRLTVSYLLISSISSIESGKRIAESILSSIDERTGIIASSDFTHYGPSYGFTPYGKDAYGRVMDEDSRTARLFAENRAEEAWEDGRKRTICGIAPATIASMIAGSLCLEGDMVMASSSADSNGDRTDFVSYRTVLWR